MEPNFLVSWNTPNKFPLDQFAKLPLRRKQIAHLRARAAKATGSEKQVLADKLRNMTPGYKVLIDSMGLAKK